VFLESSIIMGANYYHSIAEMRNDTLASKPRVGSGEQSIIRQAIIDKTARIGAGVILVNEAGVQEADADDRSYYIREGIIIVPKNAVIPNGTEI